MERQRSLNVFFFSSRRRHTRYWRDWSSDVCSSDLSTGPAGRRRPTPGRSSTGTAPPTPPGTSPTPCSCGGSPTGRWCSAGSRHGCSRPPGCSVSPARWPPAWPWCPWTSTGSPTPWSERPSASCCWAWFTCSTRSWCHAGSVPELAGRPRSGARGRRLAAGTGLALTLALGPALPASAAPADPAAPTMRCQVTDPRLPEVSGMVEVGDRMLVHNDGGDSLDVYVLDGTCTVVTVHSAAVDPYDPEDMALAVDGTVWLADTGDNNGTRTTVALLALHADGRSSVNRLAYPDGPRDVEALLLAPDGTPYLVTKEVLGASEVYRRSEERRVGKECRSRWSPYH